MSTLKVNSINDASGGSNAVLYGVAAPVGSMSFRNRIINGDMRIDQRNAGESVDTSNTTVTTYTVDRWGYRVLAASKFTVQRNAGSVTPPAGFSNYLGCTSSSAYSVGSGDVFNVWQSIEGYNTADLAFGTASAQSVTLSFWVRSSLTGTFSGAFRNNAANRSYVFTYTISAANTWEYKTVTIAGDQSGTWDTTTNTGLFVQFSLGVGSSYSTTAGSWQTGNYFGLSSATNVVGTSGATFYITGVQLEAGSVATPFERRPYGTELALCMRYFISYGGSDANEQFSMGLANSTTSCLSIMGLPVQMRTVPTLGYNSASGFLVNDISVQNTTSAMALSVSGPKNVYINATTTGLTSGRPARLLAADINTRLTFSAEL